MASHKGFHGSQDRPPMIVSDNVTSTYKDANYHARLRSGLTIGAVCLVIFVIIGLTLLYYFRKWASSHNQTSTDNSTQGNVNHGCSNEGSDSKNTHKPEDVIYTIPNEIFGSQRSLCQSEYGDTDALGLVHTKMNNG